MPQSKKSKREKQAPVRRTIWIPTETRDLLRDVAAKQGRHLERVSNEIIMAGLRQKKLIPSAEVAE